MSGSLRIEWTSLTTFFTPTVIYFLTAKSWSRKYEVYYRYLSSQSAVYFLQGKWRSLFGLVWGAFFLVVIPLAGYMFWIWNPPSTDVEIFNFNLFMAFYWIGTVLLVGWTRIFFEMRAPKTAFWYTLAIDTCIVGVIVMSLIVFTPAVAVMYIFLAVWMLMATIWTFTAAYLIPPIPQDADEKKIDSEQQPMSLPATMTTVKGQAVYYNY